ncbi:MAG: hypothetical protein ACYDHN_07880 [Solirubrobacteraceae bacterium]
MSPPDVTSARSARLLALSVFVVVLAGCGATSTAATSTSGGARPRAGAATGTPARATPPPLVVNPLRESGASWRVVAQAHGQPAVWEAQRVGVTLLRFDQRYMRLDLHAGQQEPEGTWRYGSRIAPSEIHHVVAAFNGGFKFTTGDVGWMSDGRVAEPLMSGRGSIVTYVDGRTAIGAWHQGVPARGRPVFSVLQNLSLLVDRGSPAANAEGCIQSCWGATVGGANVVARSALGETSNGNLVWAAGERLTPLALARALVAAGAARAVELDINPDWVAGYLYTHGGSGPKAVPVVPGQFGIVGQLLQPYGRDFFAVVAR